MINFDDVVKEKIKEHNSNLPQTPATTSGQKFIL